jgi:lysozyme
MIRWSEVLSGRPDADPYRQVFGFGFVINDLSDHPALLGWKGAPLDFLGPDYKGLVSTAAGAYQIRKFTWVTLKGQCGLPDFTPASQDTAALALIGQQRGALDDIENGDIESAIARCSGIWASLPGNSAGQPQQKLADLTAQYQLGRSQYV